MRDFRSNPLNTVDAGFFGSFNMREQWMDWPFSARDAVFRYNLVQFRWGNLAKLHARFGFSICSSLSMRVFNSKNRNKNLNHIRSNQLWMSGRDNHLTPKPQYLFETLMQMQKRFLTLSQHPMTNASCFSHDGFVQAFSKLSIWPESFWFVRSWRVWSCFCFHTTWPPITLWNEIAYSHLRHQETILRLKLWKKICSHKTICQYTKLKGIHVFFSGMKMATTIYYPPFWKSKRWQCFWWATKTFFLKSNGRKTRHKRKLFRAQTLQLHQQITHHFPKTSLQWSFHH